jgi:5'-3' exoribonuclease 1
MAKASETFSGDNPDSKVREIKTWLKLKGVRDFEPVSLFCDQLTKDTVSQIEALADEFTKAKVPGQIKKAIVKGIPRQAVLKPTHAVYRLQNQHFALGDRVTMVQDSGGVPLSVKGVVIGLNAKSMDVVWDVPFMSGVTLGDRYASLYPVRFFACLNLTNPQFVTSTNPKAPPPVRSEVPFKPRFGPHPAINPATGHAPAAGFRPAPQPKNAGQVHIMANPNRGRGRGGFQNGRGGHPNSNSVPVAVPSVNEAPATVIAVNTPPSVPASAPHANGAHANGAHVPPAGARGFPPRGRGGFVPGFRGRGGFVPNAERGRGARGGFRGRSRGSFAAPLPS